MTLLRRACLSLALVVAGCGTARPVAEPTATITPAPVSAPVRLGDAGELTTPELVAIGPEPVTLEAPPPIPTKRAPVDPRPLPAVAIGDPNADPERGMMIVDVGGRYMGLPIQETMIDTLVTGTVAETTVTQLFVNPHERPIEAVYRFPLPHDAAVDDYWIHVGQRHVHGVMKKREDARRTYEEAREAGHTAALLDQERPNIFSQHVANIPPGESVRVEMHLVQPLELDRGRFALAFPTTIGPRFNPGAPASADGDTDLVPDGSKITPPTLPPGVSSGQALDVSVRIASSAPVGALRSPSHRLVTEQHPGGVAIRLAPGETRPDRDFVLEWSTAAPTSSAELLTQTVEGQRYFSLSVLPPTTFPKRRRRPRELVFVVDTSGSMSGLPLDTARRTMERFISDLEPDDSFTVLRFSESVSGLSEDPLPATPANVRRGLEYVSGLDASGGTYMLQGIQAALRFPGHADRVRTVVFLTDGFIGNEAQIFDTIDAELGEARLFALGIGGSVNRHLLDGMAHAGRGLVHVQLPGEDPVALVDRFYAAISTPVLTDVEVDWGELPVRDVTPNELPDLFAGRPLVVRGKLEGDPHGIVKLRGRLGRKSVEIPVRLTQLDAAGARSRETVGLASLWARETIDDLARRHRQSQDPAAREALESRITRLALEHRVMTEYTSFVAVDARRVANRDGTYTSVEVPVEMPRGVTMEKGQGRRRPNRAATASGTLGVSGSGEGYGYGRGGGGAAGGGLVGESGSGAPLPTVRPARPEVTGSTDRAVIKRVVRAHLGELRRCYEQALTRLPPGTGGKVVVRFAIDGRGKVVAVQLVSSEIQDASFESCVTERIERLTFPARTCGIDWVVYPLVFEPR